MRPRTPVTLVAVVVLTCSAALAQEGRQKDERVIDDFVLSRGVSFEEPGRKRASHPPRRNNKGAGGGASGRKPAGKGVLDARSGRGGESEVAGHESGVAQFLNEGGALRPLALGYTILMKDDTGRLFVADPRHEFKAGERFAVALETNADGYLYLFGAENGRDPELLFPNAQIDGGANACRRTRARPFRRARPRTWSTSST